MKKMILCATALTAILSVQAQTKKPVVKTTTVAKTTATTANVFKNSVDSFSYAAGMSVATSMQAAGANKLNTQLFAKAMNDVYSKGKTALTKEQSDMTLQQKLQEFTKKRTDAQKAEGIAFLAGNKKRAGVSVTASGVQYEVLKPGEANGLKPKATDTVVVNYLGTLTNSTEFDNSYKRGQPATFPLNGVIKGWTEVMQLMPKGAKWRVYIPSDLAYGEYPPQGSPIPPNAVLIFEIALEDIKQSPPLETK